jgi:hypothetical protein
MLPSLPQGAELSAAVGTAVAIGSTVRVRCSQGWQSNFTDVSETQVTCLPNGRWPAAVAVPRCRKARTVVCYNQMVNMPHILAPAPGMTPMAQTLQLQCEPGYEGSPSAVCSSIGTWTNQGSCNPGGLPPVPMLHCNHASTTMQRVSDSLLHQPTMQLGMLQPVTM